MTGGPLDGLPWYVKLPLLAVLIPAAGVMKLLEKVKPRD
jgi:hypothetical protein